MDPYEDSVVNVLVLWDDRDNPSFPLLKHQSTALIMIINNIGMIKVNTIMKASLSTSL